MNRYVQGNNDRVTFFYDTNFLKFRAFSFQNGLYQLKPFVFSPKRPRSDLRIMIASVLFSLSTLINKSGNRVLQVLLGLINALIRQTKKWKHLEAA